MLARPPVQGVPLLRVSARVLERLLALVPPPVLPLQPLLKWLLVRPRVQPQVRQLGMAPLQERLFRGPCLRELANSRPALPGRFCPAPLRWAPYLGAGFSRCMAPLLAAQRVEGATAEEHAGYQPPSAAASRRVTCLARLRRAM